MDERFTDSARDVIHCAVCAAQLLGHSYAGTEHLLLALIDRAPSATADLLARFGVEPRAIRDELGQLCEKRPQRIAGDVAEIPHTPRFKLILQCAVDEADLLKHEFAGVEHLLLGMLREADGVAGHVLSNQGVRLEEARLHVRQLLGPRQDAGRFVERRPPIDSVGEAPDAAHDAVRRADEYARQLQHEYVGCQHLMLALVEDDRSAAARVFANLGASLRSVRRRLLETIIPGPHRLSSRRSLPLTPGLARALRQAGKHCVTQDVKHITTAHLLLGLLASDSIAVEVLYRLDMRPETVRAEALYLTGHRGGGAAAESAAGR